MTAIFWIAAVISVIATARAVTCLDGVHALLYLIVSFLAMALIFLTFGAPFIAALEVIIYAGAIIVLIVFVVMMLNLGADSVERERRWLTPGVWLVPSLLTALLVVLVLYAVARGGVGSGPGRRIGPDDVSACLFGPYALGVELASFLLLAALIGAYHLGRPQIKGDKP